MILVHMTFGPISLHTAWPNLATDSGGGEGTHVSYSAPEALAFMCEKRTN